MKRVSASKLCALYQSSAKGRINARLLYDIGSQLNQIAQSVPTFDQEDHDWGKDAGHFHHAYTKACAGQYPSYLYKSAEEYLMHSIDTLLSGCHTSDDNVADCYIEGGKELLDTIFEWDGKGSLFNYYRTRSAMW